MKFKTRPAGQYAHALFVLGLAAAAFCARGANVSSLTLDGGQPTAVMHSHYAFSQIRITFDADVHVDAYDLHLSALSPATYKIPVSLFSYNSANRTAVWTVEGQGL